MLLGIRNELYNAVLITLEWFLFSDVAYKVASLRRLFGYSLSQVVADISRGRIAAKEAYHIQEANDPLIQPNRLISTSISSNLTFSTLQDIQRSDYTPSIGELFALSYLMNAAS